MVKVDAAVLDEIVRRIVATAHPREVVLFGSRGRGEADEASDVDVLVIADSDEPRHRRSVALYGALSDILAPMDIIVYTPEEVEEWRDVPQALVTTALREGRVMYEDKG